MENKTKSSVILRALKGRFVSFGVSGRDLVILNSHCESLNSVALENSSIEPIVLNKENISSICIVDDEGKTECDISSKRTWRALKGRFVSVGISGNNIVFLNSIFDEIEKAIADIEKITCDIIDREKISAICIVNDQGKTECVISEEAV
ncbi:MAG: hypothetical protein ABFQ53_02145 [Patescibacteria group bacterium]